eukprot:5875448-Heterocapsa_arctica.AAC.1
MAPKQQEVPGDPRKPGGVTFGQPKRKGCMAAEGQVRAVEVVAGPGMFDQVPQDPEACQAKETGRQQQLEAGKTSGSGFPTRPSTGKGGDGSGKEPWADWNGPKNYQEEALEAELARMEAP